MMDLTKIGKTFGELDDTTHPAGTADLVKHLRGGLVMVSVGIRAADRIEELETALAAVGNASAHRITDLETALTRANAATAAAYEVAARRVEREGHSLGDEIRALATPDQTAALDKLIAEAVDAALKQAAFWVEEAMVIVAPDGVPQRMALDSYRKQFSTLVLASKKGGV